MENFEYKNPVKIIFGKGEIAKLTENIPANANILMTCGGGSIKKNGVYNQVSEALKNAKVTEFWGIEANPKYETLMKAVEIVRNNKIDFLLAVGGGSVLDGTKFIAAASLAPKGKEWDILKGTYEVKNAVKLASVLTLPATGSEMNANSVVSRLETNEKLAFSTPHCFPQFSILDPETTFSLSERQRVNGVVDAFVHVCEQYLTYDVNSPLQNKTAEAVLTTLVENSKKYVEENDYETAANIMWASTVALNGQLAVGVPSDWATHGIGHEITAFHGVDHARTLAIVQPSLLKVQKQEKKDKLLRLAKYVWGICEGSEEEIIDKGIAKTEEFYRSLGVKTKMSEYDIPKSTVKLIAERFKKRAWPGLGERKDISPDKIEQILTMAY